MVEIIFLLRKPYLICCRLGNRFEMERARDTDSFPYKDRKGRWMARELRNRNPKFNRQNRPNLYYPIYVNPQKRDAYGFCPVSLEPTSQHVIKVFPLTQKGKKAVGVGGVTGLWPAVTPMILKKAMLWRNKNQAEGGTYTRNTVEHHKRQSLYGTRLNLEQRMVAYEYVICLMLKYTTFLNQLSLSRNS